MSRLLELLRPVLLKPDEEEPDGNRWLPHHALIGVLMFGVGWALWAPGGSPELGATLALVGLLVALDDVVDHLFGATIRDVTERLTGRRIGTPLDFLFRLALRWGPFRRAYMGALERLGFV